MNFPTPIFALLSMIGALAVCPVASADEPIENLQAFFSLADTTDTVRIDNSLARKLYLEGVKMRTNGVDFLNGCQQANLDKHRPLPADTLPVIRHKGFTIVGSPYHSVPVETGKNNNPRYFKRLKAALDIIASEAPDSFAAIQKTVKAKRGYIIVENICPTNGNLAFAAFLPRSSQDNFVVMVSSTLLLLDEMFSPYDVAAQLVHEMEGHAVDYYRRGTTDETHAFTVQAAFAERVGDANFKYVANRASNLRTMIKLKLSTMGTYVESK